MPAADIADARKFEVPGQIAILEGNGNLSKVELTSALHSAELYLHGAQLTHFQKRGDKPLLFLSQFSRFAEGQPIRGGIPVIFPWFGAREGEPMHGFARTQHWQIQETQTLPGGGARLRMTLPESPERACFVPFDAEYVITLDESIHLQMQIANRSPDQEFGFELCFHTYFAVGDIRAISISGLRGLSYVDKVDNITQKREAEEKLVISQEVDRVYFDAPRPVEIIDSALERRILIEKEGALSTVVWNPWALKAQQMPDLGNEEYKQMVCVESGNVGKNRVVLGPQEFSTVKVKISSLPL